MPEINVMKPFRLNLGTKIHEFSAGVHEVEEDIASHFYTLLHAERLPEPSAAMSEAPGVGASEEPNGTPHVDPREDADEKTALQAQAESLGLVIDRRWGVKKLRDEIAAKSPV